MSQRRRFLFKKHRPRRVIDDGEKQPYRLGGSPPRIRRIPEDCEDEFLYYYRQHRSQDAYPDDWFAQPHSRQRPLMRHSYTFPAPDSSSISVAESYTSSSRHHPPDFSRESSEYDFRSCYSSAPRHHYSLAGSEAGFSDGGHPAALRDDLSGMLRTKMNLLNRATSSKDDHDSGHSSSGTTASNNSPAFLGVRHRSRFDSAFQNSLEEGSSMYSYCSARDRGLDEDSGVSSVTTICTNNNDNHVHSGGLGGTSSKLFIEDDGNEDQPTYWTPPPSSCSRKSSAPSSMSHDQECPPYASNGTKAVEEAFQDDNLFRQTCKKTSNPSPYSPDSFSPSLKPSVLSSPSNQWNICRKMSLSVLFALGAFLLVTFVAVHDELKCQQSRQQMVLDKVTLSKMLNDSVFGQNLAINQLKQSLMAAGPKSLVDLNALLLVGWVGTGKSFVARLIEENFIVQSNVHKFSVPLHLSDVDKHYLLDDLSVQLERSCGPSLIIFEDVDDGNWQAQQKLEEFIQNLASLSNYKDKRLLIVATMSTGGQTINRKMLEWIKTSSLRREDISIDHIRNVLEVANIELQLESALVTNGFHTTVVPFLPLTREHVTKCLIQEMLAQGGGSPSIQDTKLILDEMEFFSESFPVFAAAGCKRISGKVAFLLASKDSLLGVA